MAWVQELATSEEKQDKHFTLFGHDNLIRRLFERPQRLVEPYVTNGQVVADLSCGPGFFTIALAEAVGPEGKVFAVDSDEKAIRALEKKSNRLGCHNIEAHVSSASDLSFIRDQSVDFVLANRLLCSMAAQQRDSAMNEIRRILKSTGLAYLSVTGDPWSYVSRAEWESILQRFTVERRGDGFPAIGDRWAVVSTKESLGNK